MTEKGNGEGLVDLDDLYCIKLVFRVYILNYKSIDIFSLKTICQWGKTSFKIYSLIILCIFVAFWVTLYFDSPAFQLLWAL